MAESPRPFLGGGAEVDSASSNEARNAAVVDPATENNFRLGGQGDEETRAIPSEEREKLEVSVRSISRADDLTKHSKSAH